jgi:hypothetical protein
MLSPELEGKVREAGLALNAVVAGARRTVRQDISCSGPEPQKEVPDDNL